MLSSDNIPNSDPTAVNAVKEYLAPIFMGIVGLFLWRDITEMKSDVKTLLLEQSANNIKIENVIADVSTLKTIVFDKDNDFFRTKPSQPAKKEDEITIH